VLEQPRHASCSAQRQTSSDASVLLMPLVKFLSPTAPRWLSTRPDR
jgi:hypothetical protein